MAETSAKVAPLRRIPDQEFWLLSPANRPA